MVHSYCSTRLARDLLSGSCLLNENVHINIPLLVCHGLQDEITSPEASKKFVERVKQNDKTFKEYEGLKHELHFELPSNKKMVINFYIDWIIKRC